MGSCLVVQVTLSDGPGVAKKRSPLLIKNNIIVPELSNTWSDEEDPKNLSAEDISSKIAEKFDNESHPTSVGGMKRRCSLISNLTMDEAMILLDKQMENPHLARRVSLIMFNDSQNVRDEDEVKLMKEMVQSYLQVMDQDKLKMTSLLLQLYHLESEIAQSPSTPSAAPPITLRRQRRRSSVLCGIKEEFRQAVLTHETKSSSFFLLQSSITN